MSDFEPLRRTHPKPWEARPPLAKRLLPQLRRTPWLLLSVLAHAVLIGTAMLFATARPREERPREIVATVEPRLEEPFRPEEKPSGRSLEVEGEPKEEPVSIDSDRNEPAQADEHGRGRGEPDARTDSPFEAKGLNDVIGVGGGAGAKYGGRFGGKRDLRAGRGGQGTEEPLRAALEWLKDHQSPDGRWDCDGFAEMCKAERCDGPGESLHDVGVTGLALLAFLGDGNTHRLGPYRESVQKGLRWLLGQEDRESGLFGEKSGSAYLYGHAIATLALSEAYHLSNKSPLLKAPVQRAVRFILRARNPSLAWRYGEPPDGQNDTSVTGWMVFALKSAEDAGLEIDRGAFEGALAWFDRATDARNGRCGYQETGSLSSRRAGTESRFPPDKTESLTAVALLCRFFLGQTPDRSPVMRLHADRLRRVPPVWDVSSERSLVDEAYWYYGTLAMFQMGGEDWKAWNAAMKKAILEHQRRDGDERGSWDPAGAWGKDGGRVYMTAIGALCLEVYYRYSRILGGR
ncbi:MAG TPA: hypothetical protein VFI25_08205 [Planctomycetota bacterium]|nr:hypothetical protein [Planctomycetota bacterium]